MTDFREKKLKTSNFNKIRLVGADLLYEAGKTDGHDEANSRFSQFCEGATNLTFFQHNVFMYFVWVTEQTDDFFIQY